ncbi:hypothetical protein F5Y11DRAFT_233959 [Daldinia sp. FL1419]|nr:hypothetical protein F5Y11DRAFT_233959 [Daldinia sp. FL1419]
MSLEYCVFVGLGYLYLLALIAELRDPFVIFPSHNFAPSRLVGSTMLAGDLPTFAGTVGSFVAAVLPAFQIFGINFLFFSYVAMDPLYGSFSLVCPIN